MGVLWAAAMFAWFFLSALYLQLVLGLRPLQVGLVFLPANLIMAAFSLGLSARLVMRFGIKLPVTVGLLLAAAGLALLTRAPVDGNVLVDVLPSMILLGFGAGIAFNPMLLAAMSDVAPHESGLASGLVNTSFMMGGALGSRSLPAWPPPVRATCLSPEPTRWLPSTAATRRHSSSARSLLLSQPCSVPCCSAYIRQR